MGCFLLLRIWSIVVVLVSTQVAWAQDWVPGELIIKLRSDVSKDAEKGFLGKSKASGITVKGNKNSFGMHHFKLKPGQNMQSMIENLKNDPNVEYVEPNYIIKKQSAGVERIMSASEAKELVVSRSDVSASSLYAQTSAPIQVPQSWALAKQSGNVAVVAVIDTGVDYNHDVFVQTGAIWNNVGETPNNGIDDDRNGYIDDVRGWNFVSNNNNPMDDDNHGTHVAGIVLGATQDIMADNLEPAKVHIMPLKFLDADGQGTTADAIRAIEYAINNGAVVLNNSWGGGNFSQALEDAIVTAYNARLTFVAAAGNAANNNDSSPTYPANYDIPNVMAIAATNNSDTSIASFSNYGKQTVDVGSPGTSILSTLPGNSYGLSSGTSMAAPFVSGIAGLLKWENPDINGYQMKLILSNSANKVSYLANKVSTESRINALNSMNYVQTNSISGDQPAYSSSADLASTGAGGCGMIARHVYKNSGSGRGGSGGGLALISILLLLAPLLIAYFMHEQQIETTSYHVSRRQYQRYQIQSEVFITSGGKKTRGKVSSISMGGARIDTEAMFEKGGQILMSISSPDGREVVEVEGKVVWSEDKRAYGVQFSEVAESTKFILNQWMSGLVKI